MMPVIESRFLTFLAAILLVGGSTAPACYAPQSGSFGSERAAITAVLSAQQDAWNRGDVDTFLQGYWRSPELTFSGSGGLVRGWEGVRARYKEHYPNRETMGELKFSALEIRLLGQDAALVLGHWRLARQKGDIGGVFSLVFQRFPEGWRIIHDHTSEEPAPPKD